VNRAIRTAASAWLTVLVIVGALSAIVITVMGLRHDRLVIPLAMVASGILVLLSTGTVLALRHRSRRPTELSWWIASAMVGWSIGQVVDTTLIVSGSTTFPLTGVLLSSPALLLIAWALLTVPSHRRRRDAAVRLVLDAMVLGVTSALLIWWFGFRFLLDSHTVAFSVMLAGSLVVMITVVYLSVLTAVRDLDLALVAVAVGVVFFSGGMLESIHAVLTGSVDRGWTGIALLCMAWPVITVGTLSYRTPRKPVDRDGAVPGGDTDARVASVGTTGSLVLLAVGLIVIIVSGAQHVDSVSLWLVLSAVVMFWLRELLNNRQRAELLRQVHDEATADPLTRLANRRVLTARLASLPPGESWSLLVIDIDGFKDFNDLFGHQAGDRLLRAAAHRLSSAAPPRATVSRLGGDEFAVLVPGDRLQGMQVGQRLVAAVRLCAGDVQLATRMPVSASVGVAEVREGRPIASIGAGPLGRSSVPGATGTDTADPLAALSAAGAAQRRARGGGHDRVELFDGAVARLWQRRLTVEDRLRAAVATGDISVHFQPIVDLRSHQVTGAEALARWHDAELGSMDPSEFIAVAEQTGLVVPLGEIVLNRTLDEVVRTGLVDRGLRISYNASPLQLRVPGFHRLVAEALDSHRLPPDALVVEVTEAALVEEEGLAVRTLRRLSEAGVSVAIDDFGTGYSALGYLRRLPADILKVDKSLTMSLAEPRALAITRTVVDLAHAIGLSIVVEGVETPAVAELVTRMGAGYGQGALYGVAGPAERLVEVCDRFRGTSRPA
jgi:diguanylate cyclase (GGDEF)-like protein